MNSRNSSLCEATHERNVLANQKSEASLASKPLIQELLHDSEYEPTPDLRPFFIKLVERWDSNHKDSEVVEAGIWRRLQDELADYLDFRHYREEASLLDIKDQQAKFSVQRWLKARLAQYASELRYRRIRETPYVASVDIQHFRIL